MTKAKTKRMPGKERPVASRLLIPVASHNGTSPQESLHKHETLHRPSHRENRRGSRLPIPSEPAPCHRPWITLQGATPAVLALI